MDKRKYTSGEIAAAAGLTIRAVQHYDNIGLLRSAGRTEGGRRYYTQADLIQLQQIVLYKSLGFSLEQIKKNLLFEPNRDELLEVFKNQQLLLLSKIEHLHTSFVALSIMSDRVQEEKEVPLMLFLQFFSALPGDDIFAQANQMLDEQQAELSLHFGDLEQTRQFYHKWKEILIEAMLLIHENFSPESQKAQDLVKRWWDAVIAYTGGDMGLIKQLSELKWEERMLSNDSETMNAARQFMDDAFAIFAWRNDNIAKQRKDFQMIRIKSLTKKYADKIAVNNISFQVQPGVVTGFLGPRCGEYFSSDLCRHSNRTGISGGEH